MLFDSYTRNTILLFAQEDLESNKISEDTFFMIETVLNNGTIEELHQLTQGLSIWNDILEHTKDLFLYVIYTDEDNEETHTQVKLDYFFDYKHEYLNYKISHIVAASGLKNFR